MSSDDYTKRHDLVISLEGDPLIDVLRAASHGPEVSRRRAVARLLASPDERLPYAILQELRGRTERDLNLFGPDSMLADVLAVMAKRSDDARSLLLDAYVDRSPFGLPPDIFCVATAGEVRHAAERIFDPEPSFLATWGDNGSRERAQALNLLETWGPDPEFIDVLRQALAHERDADLRKRIVEFITEIEVIERKAALSAAKVEDRDDGRRGNDNFWDRVTKAQARRKARIRKAAKALQKGAAKAKAGRGRAAGGGGS